MSWAFYGFTPIQEGPLASDSVAAVHLVRHESGRNGVLTIAHRAMPQAERPIHQRWAQNLSRASTSGHIVDVLAVGLTPDGRPYLVTAIGSILADDLHRSGPYGIPNAIRLSADIADGLAVAHAVNVVHGGVRPSIVQVADDGTGVLAGFNTLAPGLSAPISIDSYTAPELIPAAREGRVAASTAADVYALAATVWVSMGGRLPWATDPGDPHRRTSLPTALPGVPAGLLSCLRSAMDPDPAKRPTAISLRDALRAHVNGIGAVAAQDHTGKPNTGSGFHIEFEFNLLEGVGIRLVGRRKVALGTSMVVGVSLGTVVKGLVGMLTPAAASAVQGLASSAVAAAGAAGGLATAISATPTVASGAATGAGASMTAGAHAAAGATSAAASVAGATTTPAAASTAGTAGVTAASSTTGAAGAVGASAGTTAGGIGAAKIATAAAIITAATLAVGVAVYPGSDYTNINVVTWRGYVGQPTTMEIYIMKADGEDMRRLTTNEADDHDPDLFHDEHIVFTSDRDGGDDIYTMNADGTAQQRITTDRASDLWPRWSPDGRQITFTSDRSGAHQIYTMNADGSEPRQLRAGEGSNWCSAWSPDGGQVAFTSNRDGNDDIYAMRLDGSNVRRLTSDAGSDRCPVWSPDGRRLVFTSGRHGQDDVYIVDSDGGNERRLTASSAEDDVPFWSPDGKKILFNSGRGLTGGADEMWMMNPDGTSLTKLTHSNGPTPGD